MSPTVWGIKSHCIDCRVQQFLPVIWQASYTNRGHGMS